MPYKIPVSVLVLIHTPALEVLLINRADRPGHWQSVTGSLDFPDEPPRLAAEREVLEETGIDVATLPPDALQDWHLQNVYDIYPYWQARYGPGVTRNTEHVFALCVPPGTPVRLSPREHVGHEWLPVEQAAARCFSPSNAAVIRQLPQRTGGAV